MKGGLHGYGARPAVPVASPFTKGVIARAVAKTKRPQTQDNGAEALKGRTQAFSALHTKPTCLPCFA